MASDVTGDADFVLPESIIQEAVSCPHSWCCQSNQIERRHMHAMKSRNKTKAEAKCCKFYAITNPTNCTRYKPTQRSFLRIKILTKSFFLSKQLQSIWILIDNPI